MRDGLEEKVLCSWFLRNQLGSSNEFRKLCWIIESVIKTVGSSRTGSTKVLCILSLSMDVKFKGINFWRGCVEKAET